MKTAVLLLAFCGGIVLAADSRPRVLALASDNWLAMSIGKFDPREGWIPSTSFYAPPEPGGTVTLYGTSGKLGEVVVDDPRRADPLDVPAAWSAHVTRGPTKVQPFALAILGSWPDAAVHASPLPLDDPDALRIASDFLKTRGLKVEAPFLTEAYLIDLDGDGRPETLLCAHSDLTSLRDDEEGVVYALALLHFKRGGKEKTIPLMAQASLKPAHRSIEEHERFHGKRDFNRLLAFNDIDGDGRREITLYRARDAATQVEVFTFDGHRARRVLSAYKPGYN